MKLNNLRVRVTAMLTAAVMAAALAPAALAEGEPDKYAEGDTITISNADELEEAILNQKANQTWILQPGEYVIDDSVYNSDAFTISQEQHFVFPIVSDGLTIKGDGTGDVLITSSVCPSEDDGGVWHNQNFITIDAEGVTIQDVDLKGNPNEYYDGQCNKVIELVGNGKDLHLKNVDLQPIEGTDGKINSGSIYISVEAAGATTLEDVTLYSWINARKVTSGSVTATNVVEDFTNNTYAGFSYDGQ